MANVELQDAQNVDIALSATDAGGQPATLVIDANTLTATFADATEWVVTTDEVNNKVNVKATGTLVAGDVLTINASMGSKALAPLTFTFDEIAGPATALTGVVGTPVAN